MLPIIPKPLKPGDVIGCFSPSSPITATSPIRTQRAIDYLRTKGHPVKMGHLSYQKDAYRSGSIKDRAAELNALILDPEVKLIMSTIGGMNANALLPYIDYEALLANPKWIMGYSDVTAILMGVYAKTGITTLYGPALVASFGEFEPFVGETYTALQRLFDALAHDTAYRPAMPPYWTDAFIPWETQTTAKPATENQWLSIAPGDVSGRLLVANLNTLTGIWGSPYMPAIEKGDILLLEDSLKDAATVERSFVLMALNGVFDRIGGLILGKHELFNDLGSQKRPHEILLEILTEPKMPILADYDCCHTHPMISLPIGLQARLFVPDKGQPDANVSPFLELAGNVPATAVGLDYQLTD